MPSIPIGSPGWIRTGGEFKRAKKTETLARNEAIKNGYFALGYDPRTFTKVEEFFKLSNAS